MKSSKGIEILSILITATLPGGIRANPQVAVNQGTLEGATVTTDNGFTYNAFSGIPYAKPPVGDLRFQDPHRADGWEGVRDATSEGNVCASFFMAFDSNFVGQEDCLYLNVYVPKNAVPTSKLPVMFWIHGGGFSGGSGNSASYGPDYLIEKNVIIVTINYRLGPLGFLCLHTSEVPGNAGLKDQIMALQWVNDNIHYFGGNKDKITIFGESAGGASVNFLIMSPLATGLFSQAIAQSGGCINEWAIQSTPVSRAFKMGELLGLQTNDKQELLQFLKDVPTETLVMTAAKMPTGNSEIFMAPVLEQSYPEVAAFLTEDPRELLLSGKFNRVPTITGITSNEGAFLVVVLLHGVNTDSLTLDELIPDFRYFIPKHLALSLDSEKKTIIANNMKDLYFNNSNSLIVNFETLTSDYFFVKDGDFSAKLFSQYSPSSYYYRFSYFGNLKFLPVFTKYSYKGAAHTDELAYLFKNMLPLQPTASDVAKINEMTDLWTNFAKFGNPTPQLSENIKVMWDPISNNQVNCLDIDTETTLIQKPFEKRMQFWNNLNSLI